MVMTDNTWNIGFTAFVVAAAMAGCGGNSGGGVGVGTESVTVSGTVSMDEGAAASADGNGSATFRIRATGSSGSMHETETDSTSGRFTLMLPPNDSYVMGFGHRDTTARQMHFAGNMVFGCQATESDHFFISGRERTIDLGTVVVRRDGSFARPERNPMEQVDRDGDGIPDARDPDSRCADVGDHNHDGFYDDDMDHNGHHDADDDGYGNHACHIGGMHGDDDPNCLTPPTTLTATPMAGPTPTPDNHMSLR